MENRIIVAFHTGRGGRFYNGGHVTYIGEKNFQDLIQMNSQDLFERNRDEFGRFTKSHLIDSSGTVIVEPGDMKALTGYLNFDNEYDTDACCYIEDCSDEQLELIAGSSGYKSPELLEYLESKGITIENDY